MKRRVASILFAAGTMILLILDTKTAISGAAKGIELCMNILIPSLFPFLIISIYLNSSILGLQIPGMRAFRKLLHLPSGAESVLLLGLIGGYPVGAQLVADSYTGGQVSTRTGRIMLGYCSNAGPAFIFGVTGILFSTAWVPFLLWGIHIISALLTGILLPRPKVSFEIQHKEANPSFITSVSKSITVLTSICGWVVVFKIIIAYLQLWIKTSITIILSSGILELSNGCLLLSQIPHEADRFILCSAFLAFGGTCVLMQTSSLTGELGLGLYIPGKILQTMISTLIAVILSCVLFSESHLSVSAILLVGAICLTVIAITRKCAEIVVEKP